eukprot:g1948.t1
MHKGEVGYTVKNYLGQDVIVTEPFDFGKTDGQIWRTCPKYRIRCERGYKLSLSGFGSISLPWKYTESKFADKFASTRCQIPPRCVLRDGSRRLQESFMGRSLRFLRQITRKRNKVIAAVKIGNIPQVKYWLRRGVNINNVDKDGKTALNLAVCSKNKEMVQVLLRMGKDKINVNKQDNDGFTPLLRAVQMTLGTDIMEMLLAKRRTNPNIQNKYGWTPLYLSISNSFWSQMFLLMKDRRTDMNLVGSNGYSPLGRAYCAGANYYTNEQIVGFVRTAGGSVCTGCHLCPSRRNLRLGRDEWVDFD